MNEPQGRGRDWEIHTYLRSHPWGGDDTDAQIANYRRWIKENQWVRWDPNPMPMFRLFWWFR